MTADLSFPPFGVRVHCVPSGTVISDESGKELKVDEGSAVVNGTQIYMTQRNYDALKNRFIPHDR